MTNGTCVDPLTFTIADAAGKQTTALLENLPGTEDRPIIPVPDLSVQPNNVSVTGCAEPTKFQFVVVGGTPPYGISTSSLASSVADPQSVRTSGGVFTIQPYNDLAGPFIGSTTVVVIDSSVPQKNVTAIINCN